MLSLLPSWPSQLQLRRKEAVQACSYHASHFQGPKSLEQQSCGPSVVHNAAVRPVTSLFDSLSAEVELLSSVVEHQFAMLVLSDCDCDAILDSKTGSVNDHCGLSVSPLSAFLQMTDLAGHHLLLHPSCADLYACLDHYHAHKSDSTSACVVMPKQAGMWRKFLRRAQLLKDYPCCDALFVPSVHSEGLGKHAVQVYYDSPVVTESACPVIGSLGLTMHFHGTVSNAPVSLLFDSGCSHTLMSASYARRVGITLDTQPGDSLQVALASGMVCSSIGTCKVRLQLQQYTGTLSCFVVELADAYEVILGEDWLSKHAATMSYKHKCCVIDKGSQRYNLVPDGGSAESAPSGSTSFAPVTAIQANRALTHGCTGFLVVCTAAQTSPATCAAANPHLAAQPAESHLMPESELESSVA